MVQIVYPGSDPVIDINVSVVLCLYFLCLCFSLFVHFFLSFFVALAHTSISNLLVFGIFFHFFHVSFVCFCFVIYFPYVVYSLLVVSIYMLLESATTESVSLRREASACNWVVLDGYQNRNVDLPLGQHNSCEYRVGIRTGVPLRIIAVLRNFYSETRPRVWTNNGKR